MNNKKPHKEHTYTRINTIFFLISHSIGRHET